MGQLRSSSDTLLDINSDLNHDQQSSWAWRFLRQSRLGDQSASKVGSFWVFLQGISLVTYLPCICKFLSLPPPGGDGQTIEQLLRPGSTLGCCAVLWHGRIWWSPHQLTISNWHEIIRSEGEMEIWCFVIHSCLLSMCDMTPCLSAVQVLTLGGCVCVWILYSFITQWVSQQLTTHSKTANMRQLIPACALKVHFNINEFIKT